MIRFTCVCGKQLQAQDEHAGRKTRCPDCGRELVIEAASGDPQPAEAIRTLPEEKPRRGRYEDDEEDEAPRPQREGTSGKAVASLILGLMSLVCSLLTGIPAIILGILGLRDVSQSDGRVKGQGLAIAGIITGGLGTILMLPLIAIMVGLLLPAVQKVREAASRMSTQNNLKQLSLAMLNYEATNGSLPPDVVYSKDGKPLYSWRVLLLPYLGEQDLYKEFHLDEPWDSAHNKPLLARMPNAFRMPGDANLGQTETHYQVFVGGGALFDAPEPRRPEDPEFKPPRCTRLADIDDGVSNTILFVEAADAVSWTQPIDLIYSPNKPLPSLGHVSPSGFNVAFADGSVRFVSKNFDERVLRAAITRSGHEKFNAGQLGDGP
ncbi:MAG TPA: DUF1559 domain-containing protein [Gemmataceae bacterium]|nr:DUF1559 domain-containing protein [Gemmataceae bacterium]